MQIITNTPNTAQDTLVRSAFCAGVGAVVPSNSGASSGFTYSKRITAQVAATSLRLHFSGFMSDGNGHEVVFANSYTVKAAIVLAGVVISVYFNASRTGTVNPGYILDSDVIPVSVSVGDIITVRCMPTGATVPNNCFVTPTSWGLNEFYQTSDTVDSGSMLASVVLVNAFTPCAITGMVKFTDHTSVFIFGDSISAGYEDYNKGSLAVAPNSGFIGRALANNSRGYIQGGLSGDRAQYAAALQLSGRIEMAKYCRHAILGFGSNDMNASRTALQFETDMTTIVTKLRALKLKKIAGCTIIPRTTSNDGWMSLLGQTNSFGANDAGRISSNTWLLSASPLDTVYDTRPAVADSGNSYGLWLAGVGSTATTIASSPTSTASRAYLNLTVTANQFESQVVGFSSGAQAGTYRNILKTIVANNSIDPDANFGGIPATSDGVVIYDNYAGIGVHPTTRGVEAMSALINVALLV